MTFWLKGDMGTLFWNKKKIKSNQIREVYLLLFDKSCLLKTNCLIIIYNETDNDMINYKKYVLHKNMCFKNFCSVYNIILCGGTTL